MLPLLKEKPELVKWKVISSSYEPWMSVLIDENVNRVDWVGMCSLYFNFSKSCENYKSWRLPLFEKYTDKLDWDRLLYCRSRDASLFWLNALLLPNVPIRNLCTYANDYMIPHLQERPDELDWKVLSMRPTTTVAPLYREFPDRVHWKMVSGQANKEALPLLFEFHSHLDWAILSRRKRGWLIPLLLKYPDKVDWEFRSVNPNQWMLPVMKSHPNLFDWMTISRKPEGWMYDVLMHQAKYLDWASLCGMSLSGSRLAQRIVQNNPQFVDWKLLSRNRQPWLARMFAANPDRVDWSALCESPKKWMNSLFNENLDRLDWDKLQFHASTTVVNTEHKWLVDFVKAGQTILTDQNSSGVKNLDRYWPRYMAKEQNGTSMIVS